jgi:LysR family transcriptional regulator (chromosome initiation inhibitor)
MNPAPSQLAALTAIADHGTFEAAARALHVTPSAISQRIRALESSVGRVVVQRTAPCRPTGAGRTLLRLARQTQLLYDEVRGELIDGGPVRTDLPVAVNADSLATWFRDVIGRVADWDDVALRLHVEDQAFSADLLRSGEALAAVTSENVAVQGCSIEHLGVLRYRPAATPAFAERWRHGRGHDWGRMPVVAFNEKDALQHDLLRARGVDVPPVVHRVPTSADFHEAVRLGLGWGVLPAPQLDPDLTSGRLVLLSSRDRIDVHLHWQRWRLDSPLLARLTDEVRRAASAHLRQKWR